MKKIIAKKAKRMWRLRKHQKYVKKHIMAKISSISEMKYIIAAK